MTKRAPAHPLTVYREERGLSQREFAEEAGLSKWTVTMIETGKRAPSPKLSVRLEALTGVPRAAFRPDIFGQAAE